MAYLNDAPVGRKAESAKLPLLYYQDLREQGIVRTWHSLQQMD
jgi:hypothetical protein